MSALSRISYRIALSFVVVIALQPGALAQTPPSGAEQARRHNAEGKKFFNLGRFDQAAAAYARAYEAKPVAAFLYNLGQCYRRLPGVANLQKARFYFRSYLNNAPDAVNRAVVEEEIAEVTAEIEKAPAEKDPGASVAVVPTAGGLDPSVPPASSASPSPALDLTADPAPSPAVSAPVYKRWWFWPVIGVVVVGAASTAAAIALSSEARSPVSGTIPPGQLDL